MSRLGFTFVFPLKLLGFQPCGQLEKSTLVLVGQFTGKCKFFFQQLSGKETHPESFYILVFVETKWWDDHHKAVQRLFLHVLLFYEPADYVWSQLDEGKRQECMFGTKVSHYDHVNKTESMGNMERCFIEEHIQFTCRCWRKANRMLQSDSTWGQTVATTSCFIVRRLNTHHVPF